VKYPCTLSVVTVIYNEDCLPAFLADVIPVLVACSQTYEIIIIANGLSAEALGGVKAEIEKYPRLRLIVLAGEHSTDLAYTAGIETSIGDYVIVMEADSDPAPLIDDMLQLAVAGTDIIIATAGQERYRPGLTRLLTRFYFKLIRLLLLLDADIDPSYFTCFSRKAMVALARYKDTVRNYRFLRTMIALPRRHIPYVPIRRSAGKQPRRTLRRLLLGVESFFSYSLAPLNLLSALSFVLGVLSFAYCFYPLLSWMFRPNIESGWTSSSIVNGIMFGSLFLILGALGEYLAILLKEVRKFPLYLVAEDISTGSLFTAFDQKNVVDRSDLVDKIGTP